MIPPDAASKTVRNISFGGARLIIGAGATICTSAMIARTLGPEKMGLYGYAMWLVGALGVVANLGLPSAITKYVSEYLGRGESATAVHIGRKLLRAQLAVAAIVLGLTACCCLFASPSYRGIIGLAALMIFAQALQQSLGAVLAGVQRFDSLAIIGFYVALAQVASVGLAAFLHTGVVGMLWATLGGLAVAVWFYYRAVDKLFLNRPSGFLHPTAPTPDIFRRIRRFTLTISYLLLLDTIVWQRSEVLFLKWYSTLGEIAFYTIAYSIASKLNDIASTFSSTLLPLYSGIHGRNGIKGLGIVYVNVLKYVQIVVVPLSFLAVAVTRPLIHSVYGESYLPLVPALQLLLFTLAFTSIGVAGSPLLVGIEKQGFMAKFGTAIAILNIALDLLLIPGHGALGAASANCAAQIVGILGGTIYIVHYIRVVFPWRAIATVYLSAAIAFAPVAYFGGRANSGVAPLIGSIAGGAALYLGLLVVTGELGKGDLGVLKEALSGARLSPAPEPAVQPA